MTSIRKKKEYQEGRDARVKAKDVFEVRSNPYNFPTDQFYAWRVGWFDVQKEILNKESPDEAT